MTLWRYILRGFLRATLAVFAVIALVIILFTAVENLRRFGESGVTPGDVMRVTLLQAPEVLYQVFPLVLMLASLVTFLRFARTSELVVMRAAGISALRLIAVPVVAALLLGVGFVAVVNPFVAASIKRGQAMVEDIDGAGANLSFSKEGVWLRQGDPGGQSVIQATRTNADGTVLSQVRMHRFDTEGTLYSRIEAPQARLTRGAWILPNAVEWRLDADGSFNRTSAYPGRLDLPTTLTSEEILESFAPPETVGFWDLGRFISQMEESGFSGLRHRLFLQSELAKPALYAAMVLIGAAFALRPTRFGQTGVMILLAVLAGFALYFLKDFAESLGGRGQIPLMVAAWTPPVAAILLAIGLLLHLEDG